jgi:hypothetical protein
LCEKKHRVSQRTVYLMRQDKTRFWLLCNGLSVSRIISEFAPLKRPKLQNIVFVLFWQRTAWLRCRTAG